MVEIPVFEMIVLLVVITAIALVYWISKRQDLPATVSNVYLEALEHLVDGNDRLAIQKLKEAVRTDTQNISAYLRLGDVLRKRGLHSNANRIHKDLTLRAGLSPEIRQQILKNLFKDYEVMNDHTNAITTGYEILKIDTTPEPWLIQSMLNLLEKKQQWQEAITLTQKHAKLLPVEIRENEALYIVFQGQALSKAARHKDSRVKYKEALKKNTNCAAAYYYLGKSYASEGRLEDAAETWTRFCRAMPTRAHIVYPELERVWFELGRFFDAENLYRELFEANRNHLPTGIALAEIYHKKGDHDTAMELLNQMEEYHADGNTPLLIEKKAKFHFSSGHYKQAATLVMQLLNNTHGNSAAVYSCSICQYETHLPVWICSKCQNINTFNL